MRLNIKLALYISILAIVSSGIISVFSYQSIQNKVREEVLDSVLSLVETVSSMIETAAYLNNVELASESIAGLEVNSIVSCVKIATNSMVAVGTDSCGSEPFYQKSLYSPFDHTEYIGEIFIYEDVDFINEKANDRLFREVIIIIEVILLVSALILVITYLVFTQPVQRLADLLKTIDFSGNKVERLPESQRNDEISYITGVINRLLDDASARISKERSLTRKTALLTTHFKMVFDLSSNALAVTDEDLRLKSYNRRFEELISRSLDIKTLQNTSIWLEGVTTSPKTIKKHIFAAPLSEKPETLDMEFSFNDDETGATCFFALTFVKTRDETGNITTLIFINDITEHRQQLLESQYNANHDNLTHLLNRRAAAAKIQQLIAGGDNTDHRDSKNNKDMALLVIDLDGFKSVNDNYGHEAGDKILQVVSQRLSASTRKSDVVSRWGGDEFLVVLSNVTLADAKAIADKILEMILQPIKLYQQGHVETVGASIGLVMYSDCDGDFSEWFDLADRAMYRVKQEGRRSVLVYDKSEELNNSEKQKA